MNPTRVALIAICAVSTSALVLLLVRPSILDDDVAPQEPRALSAWVATHPADWRAARALSETALDSNLPRRVFLWRAAFDHAHRLAPLRPHAAMAFVRGGLFHWQELSPADQRAILAAAAPLLGDPTIFHQLHGNIWQLTRDFAYLRKAAPDTPEGLQQLRDLALRTGQFDSYRELRESLRAKRLEKLQRTRDTATVVELLSLLPERPDRGDLVFLRLLLDEIARRTEGLPERDERSQRLVGAALDLDVEMPRAFTWLIDAESTIEAPDRARLALAFDLGAAAARIAEEEDASNRAAWVAYFADRARFEAGHRNAGAAEAALARAAEGLDAAASAALRAEVYAALGNAERARESLLQVGAHPRPSWTGPCGSRDLCGDAHTVWLFDDAGRLTVHLSVVQSDEIPPYVEFFVDQIRVAEGPVGVATQLTAAAITPGPRHLELRLMNRATRGGIQRRVTLS